MSEFFDFPDLGTDFGGGLDELPGWLTGDLPDGEPGGSGYFPLWGGGGPEEPGGANLGGGDSGGVDWTKLLSGLGGGAGSSLNSIIKAITGGGGGSGSSTGLLGQLLPLLLAGAGGALNYNRTNKASDAMINAANKANEQVTGILGGHSKNYDAYTAAGNKAIAAMSGAAPSNLAGQFQSNMASQFKPLQGMTLANYARGR